MTSYQAFTNYNSRNKGKIGEMMAKMRWNYSKNKGKNSGMNGKKI
jgi:hypothetical protein